MIDFPRKTLTIACSLICFSGATTLSADENVRDELANTLDNLQATAAGLGMQSVLKDQFDQAYDELALANPAELSAVPQGLQSKLRILELSSEQMRLSWDPALRKPAKTAASRTERAGPDVNIGVEASQPYDSGALSNPSYPSVNWSFAFEDSGTPGDSDTDSGSGSGLCSYPGYTVNARFTALNVAIALEAVKDIAEQACGQDILGENGSLFCVVTDIAAYIAIGIDSNQELCNDSMTAAEVTASWNGIKTVHGNVQNVYDSLGTHDGDIKSAISTHDTAVSSQLSTHDSDVKTALATHDSDIKDLLAEILDKQGEALVNQATIIELLNTPQGTRPDWNKN